MLVIEQRAQPGARPTEQLILSFERRSKSRLRTRLASGEEVGLSLQRGVILRGGDMLLGDDGRVVQVVAAPEQLAEAICATPLLLARATYHLGNRHAPEDTSAVNHPIQDCPGCDRKLETVESPVNFFLPCGQGRPERKKCFIGYHPCLFEFPDNRRQGLTSFHFDLHRLRRRPTR